MEFLHLGVLLSMTWAALALVFLHVGAKAYGKRTLFSKPAGDPAKGAAYAFTVGMLPWAKESVRTNLLSYGAGMVFHAGVFTAFAQLLCILLGWELPAILVRTLGGAGAACGIALFVKRLANPALRGLSTPDDFISNLLTTLFVLLAFMATFNPAMGSMWLAEAILLLVYAPLGKIRHCLFFFTTRYHLGAFFGRRGTYPPGGDLHA
jgi:hypothetical protein